MRCLMKNGAVRKTVHQFFVTSMELGSLMKHRLRNRIDPLVIEYREPTY